ncbi:hypothetical protein [Sinorhizobium meliloti]|uniref:Y-family DNA polymerase n=1 Tax=Rhizobium meliloti TaxID=382 RepID=UPI001F34E46D|nr:hypothetical protein [Sinorhizobium meliloti]WQO38587.1 hypothetical protein U8C34_05300 [Sinorhizobium meliloti]
MEIATVIAQEIRAKIKATTELSASAGISYNKFLAKMASGQNKPDASSSSRRRTARPLSSSFRSRSFTASGPPQPKRCIGLG